MAELRYNPMLDDWTMVASNRQKRPNLPTGSCPFCPGSGKVPDSYEVLAYDNDFPVLSGNPPTPDDVAGGPYRTKESYGKCEVVLYSPDHAASLASLPVAHIRKLIDLWVERFVALSQNPQHKYVYIFENRGPEVGATMPHPHGQIYAFPYIPLKIQRELEASEKYHRAHGECLLCAMNREESQFAGRMLLSTDHFESYLPFFTDYPYGAFIVSKSHKRSLAELASEERDDLACVLKLVTGGMDRLFQRDFPYMLALHQAPVDDEHCRDFYHFHIEFYPPLRGPETLKFLASAETGAWASANPLAVEETAPALRAAIELARRDFQR